MRALVIPANPFRPLELVNADNEGELVRATIGGYVNIARTPERSITLWVHYDGPSFGLPLNRRATSLWRALWRRPVNGHLVGEVVLTGGPDAQGNTLDVPDSVIEAMRKVGQNEIHGPAKNRS